MGLSGAIITYKTEYRHAVMNSGSYTLFDILLNYEKISWGQ